MKKSLVLLTLVAALAGCSGSTPASIEPGVVLLRYNPGSESTEQREEGFLDTLRQQYPQINLLSSDQYAGTTPESALDKSQQLLTKYRGAITGVFCVCEPNAAGMFGALEEADLLGQVKFVGFDPTPRMVQAIEDGQMSGIVLQDPVAMGYLAVKTMHAHLQGQPVEQRISTGQHVATPENIHTEQIQRLVAPPVFEGEAFQPETVKYTIAVIPKGTTHEFWKSVHHGADRAARELGDTRIIWKGPLQENDRGGQIDVVQNFITQKVDGLVLAPLDAQALVEVVVEAKEHGIPTVVFDSDLNSDAKVSYVATDNYAGGALAAHTLAEALGESPAKPQDGASQQKPAETSSPAAKPEA